MHKTAFESFLKSHQLPDSYLDRSYKAFQPVIKQVMSSRSSKQAFILGINGCQGSGKTTTADFLKHIFETVHQLKTVSISLDDFYLSKQERLEKAEAIHPLFKTRGVPGTHDTLLALATLSSLKAGKATRISRFNKAKDDLFPMKKWDISPPNVDLIILEGWCLGAKPLAEDSLAKPINTLESEQDPEGIWRTQMNKELASDYQMLFGFIDSLVMLKAPGFSAVQKWRTEQEAKLAKMLQSLPGAKDDQTGLMTESQIAYFIQHFQRLTEAMLLEMPKRADHCYHLDHERRIVNEYHK